MSGIFERVGRRKCLSGEVVMSGTFEMEKEGNE